MTTLAIDCRMLPQAGIGTYLRQLLPRLLEGGGPYKFQLLGDPIALRETGWGSHPAVILSRLSSPLYSFREQLEVPVRVAREAALFWAPHYNVPLLCRGRMLVTLHDVLPVAMPQFARGAHRRAAARLLCEVIRHRAQAVLCVSSFTASEFMRVTGARCRGLHVVHLGVDRSWFKIKRDERPHPRPYLLAVGDVKPHKNFSGLIEAFGSLIDEIPHDLVIVGRSGGFITDAPEVLVLARRYAGRVVLTGRIPEQRVQQYVAHADALVYPSFYEGFGLPPLEAMAARVPVIASAAAAIPEVCGDAALYCDPYRPADIAAKMRLLLRSAGLRQDLIEKGAERAAQFTWARTASATGAVIRAAIDA